MFIIALLIGPGFGRGGIPTGPGPSRGKPSQKRLADSRPLSYYEIRDRKKEKGSFSYFFYLTICLFILGGLVLYSCDKEHLRDGRIVIHPYEKTKK